MSFSHEDHPARVIVVLPAFNEAGAIGGLLSDIHSALVAAGHEAVRLVVVDDGSRDATAAIVREAAKVLPVTLIEHPKNLGLGRALRTGLAYAARAADDGDVVLTTEADGTQPTEKLVELCAEVLGGADFAVATPLADTEGFRGVPFYRRFLSRGANVLYGILFPIGGLSDYTNLVRAFRASLLKQAVEAYGDQGFVTRDGFESVPEILLKLRRFHPTVRQIPLVIDFTKMERGSSMHVARTVASSLSLCASMLVRNGVTLVQRR